MTHWKRLWCWEGLGARGEGGDRGWDGWIASPTWRTWVWVNSGSWWWTERLAMPQPIESQRFRHDWVAELNWTEVSFIAALILCMRDSPSWSKLLPKSLSPINYHIGLRIPTHELLGNTNTQGIQTCTQSVSSWWPISLHVLLQNRKFIHIYFVALYWATCWKILCII